MTTTYEISSINQAIDVGTTMTRSWFRGHSRIIERLTPRIHRSEFQDDVVRAFRPNLELDIIEAFRREVPTLAEIPVPHETDLLGWLYVMQHYRTPTRLLDWTTNVLVALYFVVSADRDKPGELWSMYPMELNKQSHVGTGIPLVGRNPVLRFLVEQPYWGGDPADLAKECALEIIPNRPVAFEPSRRFPRLVRQAGAFTIHPPETTGHTIPEILSDESHLVRYVVNAQNKRRIQNDLAALGIDEYTLFPELEGLSHRIEREARIMAYSPPAPPQCNGEWHAESN